MSRFVDGLCGEVQLAVAKETDQAVAQVFAAEKHEDHEHSDNRRGGQGAEEYVEILGDDVQRRMRIIDDATQAAESDQGAG